MLTVDVRESMRIRKRRGRAGKTANPEEKPQSVTQKMQKIRRMRKIQRHSSEREGLKEQGRNV